MKTFVRRIGTTLGMLGIALGFLAAVPSPAQAAPIQKCNNYYSRQFTGGVLTAFGYRMCDNPYYKESLNLRIKKELYEPSFPHKPYLVVVAIGAGEVSYVCKGDFPTNYFVNGTRVGFLACG